MKLQRIRMIARWLLWGIAVLTAFALLSVLLVNVLNARSRNRNSREQYAVWSAFLNVQFLENDHDWDTANGCLIVIHGRTARHFTDEGTIRDTVVVLFSSLFPEKPQLEIQPETYRNFLLRNVRRESMTRNFQLKSRYEIATDDDIQLFGTDKFENRFPGNCGHIQLSAVGFNGDHSEAFFRADHFCGLCGGGGFVLMRKTAGIWHLVTWDRTWVS